MKIIPRILEDQVILSLQPGKVVIIFGARRTGKTVLLQRIVQRLPETPVLFHGEDLQTEAFLSKRSINHYRNILGDRKFLIIDEAQKIEQIGAILKLMVDGIPHLRILVTGSSAFDMANKLGEPLTGRKISFHLFPISEQEWQQEEDFFQQEENLRERLVFGSYPELFHLSDRSAKMKHLQELTRDYLLKDILSFEGVRYSGKIYNLLRLIAFQAGSEVSLNELGTQLGLDKNTVDRYLHLLTQVFILYRLGGYSRNLRKEVSKSSKWYFLDNGIRNAIIANFNPLELRNDQGILWENYMISERLKHQHYNGVFSNNFFWRTYDQQEIDWVEEREGKLYAYEMKWKKNKVKIPAAWKKAYPDSEFQVIHPENFREFIL